MKWGTGSVDPDQTPLNAASDQGLHCVQEMFNEMLRIADLKYCGILEKHVYDSSMSFFDLT